MVDRPNNNGSTNRQSHFPNFPQDPFFPSNMMMNPMQHFDQMFRDPFAGFGFGNGRPQDNGRERGGANSGNAMSPFGHSPFNPMSLAMMHQGMGNTFTAGMQSMMPAGGNGFQQSSSSFVSYSNTGDGPPKVYQATTSMRAGPGGVRETKQMVRDTEKNVEKVAIGRHIHDRGQELQKHKDTRTGQVDEVQNLQNIDEHEVGSFNQEWQQKANATFRDYDRREIRDRRHDDRHERGRERQLALPPPAVTHRGEEDDRRSKGRSKGDRRRDRS